MTTRVRRNEHGAIAIMMAILAVFLFGLSAIVVDIGQAWAKRSLLQTSVDLAVMAATAELTQEDGCNVEVVSAAQEYLLNKVENTVAGQYSLDLTGSFGDGDGFISCSDWQVQLEAPASRVDYGLGRLLSTADHVDVTARATAQVKSPSQSSSLPMYAVAGCDIGPQQLTDPPPGPAPTPTVPELTPGGDPPYNGVTNLSINSPNPAEIPAGSVTPVPMTLKGKGLVGTTFEVWFTNASGLHFQAPGTLGLSTSGPNFTITVPTVPQDVLDSNGIWYVRIFNDGKWSTEADAQPLVVGDLLFCNGTVSGNFGTLKVARSDSTTGTWLEMNIIRGFQPQMTINASDAVPCSPEDSTHAPQSPSDCVGTDPGFPNEAATDGLINGSGSYPGKLNHDTTEGCDRNGGSSRTTGWPSGGPNINDDVLSCYIVGSHNVGDVIAGTANILSADIFSSPRFFQIPVIPVEASGGSSGSYPIIAFRPGFITSEPASATFPPGSLDAYNGVYAHAGHVDRLDVVLFPESALPSTAPPIGGEIEYTGHGTKVIVLVD